MIWPRQKLISQEIIIEKGKDEKDDCLHQNLEEELQGLGGSRDHVIKESIACRLEPTDSDAALESAFFG